MRKSMLNVTFKPEFSKMESSNQFITTNKKQMDVHNKHNEQKLGSK